MNIKTMGLVAAVLFTSTLSFGQKKNVTNAAIQRKAALEAIVFQKFDEAKEALKEAKGFIDLACEHADTKDGQKTLWLKGDIYSLIASLGMQTQDLEFASLIGEDGLEQAVAALKKGYGLGNKYKADISDAVDRARISLNTTAGMLYNMDQFGPAGEMYILQTEYASCVNLYDTSAFFNGALCYERTDQCEKAAPIYADLAKMEYRGTACVVLASTCYRKMGEVDKAKAIVAAAREKYPTDRELLLEVVNTSIEEGDAAGAEAALNSAIESDPKNKVLHYTIGTIYIDLKKYAEAEEALNKSLEIDPDFVEAQYQLGAHLVSWGSELKREADNIPSVDDPKYAELTKQSKEIYKRAIIPLEKYIDKYPNETSVLQILYQIHRDLKMKEKEEEYKQRFLDSKKG